MNKTFQYCVDLLEALAARLHITYEAVNVWIFVVIGPAVFMLLCWIIYKQHLMIKALRLLQA